MGFNVSDLRVYAHRSKQFHVILGKDNIRQECWAGNARAVMAESLSVLDIDDQHCDLCVAGWTGLHHFFKALRPPIVLQPSLRIMAERVGFEPRRRCASTEVIDSSSLRGRWNGRNSRSQVQFRYT